MVFKYYTHGKFFLLHLFGLLASLESIILAFIISQLTNYATRGNRLAIPGFVALSLLGLLATYGARLLFNYLQTDAIRDVNQQLRTRVLRGMINTPAKDRADALGFLTNDFKLLETNRFGAEITIAIQAYTLVFALGYALYLNWLITGLFLLGSCLPMLVSNVFQKRLQAAAGTWSQANDHYVNQTKDFLAGGETLALYQRQANAVQKAQPRISSLEGALARMNRLNLNVNAHISLVANLGAFLTPFLVGTYLVVRGQTTLGALFGIVQLANAFINPILTILAARNNLATTQKIVMRLNGYLHAADQTAVIGPADLTVLRFTNITLERQQHQLVTGIDLTLTPGKKVAVIGRSGIGKSTLLEFLKSGDAGHAQQAIINGDPVTAQNRTGLFAYASQSAVIFADTLGFNLTLGAPLPLSQIQAVCDALDIGDLVRQRGLDYPLGANADQLSGGQLERIELARALLSDRPILLLDEITASLDQQTAADVHRYLLTSPRTLVETIHHYDPADLAQYDQVIDFDALVNQTHPLAG